jgi:hypothetical protein
VRAADPRSRLAVEDALSLDVESLADAIESVGFE